MRIGSTMVYKIEHYCVRLEWFIVKHSICRKPPEDQNCIDLKW